MTSKTAIRGSESARLVQELRRQTLAFAIGHEERTTGVTSEPSKARSITLDFTIKRYKGRFASKM